MNMQFALDPTSRQLNVIVTLSKRNILALLHKVDDQESARTLYRDTVYGRVVIVAEPDADHYKDRAAGDMSPETEKFIEEQQKSVSAGLQPPKQGDV